MCHYGLYWPEFKPKALRLSSDERILFFLVSLLVAEGRPLDSLQDVLCLIIRASCSLTIVSGREGGPSGMFLPSVFASSLQCIIYLKYILGPTYTRKGQNLTACCENTRLLPV